MTSLWAFVRASRGPILLMTIGMLFAIDHAGNLPIGRSWPIFVILLGILKLLDRAIAPAMPPPPPVYAPPNVPPQNLPHAGVQS